MGSIPSQSASGRPPARLQRAGCSLLAIPVVLGLTSAAARADIELRWPAFADVAAVGIERGLDEQSFEPLARIAGNATGYRDPAPPDAARVCYRVRGLDGADRTREELVRCLTRPDEAGGAPAPVGAAPPANPAAESGPDRWRGLEGWYQLVPVPQEGPESNVDSPGSGAP